MKFTSSRLKRLYACSVADSAINTYIADEEQATIHKSIMELVVSYSLAKLQNNKQRAKSAKKLSGVSKPI